MGAAAAEAAAVEAFRLGSNVVKAKVAGKPKRIKQTCSNVGIAV